MADAMTPERAREGLQELRKLALNEDSLFRVPLDAEDAKVFTLAIGALDAVARVRGPLREVADAMREGFEEGVGIGWRECGAMEETLRPLVRALDGEEARDA